MDNASYSPQLDGAHDDVEPNASLAGTNTRLRRHPERGSHERGVVMAIIDEALLCHLAFEADGVAMSLPTAHARIGDALYLHGAAANRMLRSLRAAGRASATFTLIDGLVLARTAFHHSMNFRSALVIGPVCEVSDPDEKRLALSALVEHMVPGRMHELAPPSAAELAATLVLRMSIEEASAKTRSGPARDSAEDLAREVWAGVVPVALRAGPIERDPLLRDEQHASPAAGARAARDQLQVRELVHGDCLLSNDRSRLRIPLIHRYLSEDSYWAQGVTERQVIDALAHSECFGVYRSGEQLGFARVVTDRARFAYLADVFIAEQERGRGLGRALIQFVLDQPELRDVVRFLLGTRDAHSFYAPFGWQPTPPDRYMMRMRADRGA